MNYVNFDIDCLRTFVSVVTLGSHAKAAENVGRSLSAVSLQLGRLEDRVGQRLFLKKGRRMVLSVAGEEFLSHAQRILAANDAAARAFHESEYTGTVRLGVIQDFAEVALPRLLAEFADQYPHTRIDVLVERSKHLLDALETKKLDQIIAFRHSTSLVAESLGQRPMIWIGPKGAGLTLRRPLPLVMIEGQCTFREVAINSLDEAGIPWRVAVSSPSLSCLASAAEAGLGVCVRTNELLGERYPGLTRIENLPILPDVELCHYQNGQAASTTASRLRDFCIERLRVI
jgi:DNA-binding transcriptional LysR family regulator